MMTLAQKIMVTYSDEDKEVERGHVPNVGDCSDSHVLFGLMEH